MEAFNWNSNFVTGLADVDEQHHRLVDLINRFGTLLMSDSALPLDTLEGIFSELADYAQYHFTAEEALMAEAGVDPRHVEQHQRDHVNFLGEVILLHGGMGPDNLLAAQRLLQFLTHWLAYHILGSDQFMARQIAAIRAGCSPEQAFASETPRLDPTTDTLLNALSALFQQVSERNRELVELNKTLEARVAERTQALREANEQLEDLAHTDTLTDLPNRRHALRTFASEWATAERDDLPLACMMIDADGFKRINDTQGHDAGDAVLRALALALKHAVRTDDLVCRLGGDEFLIICPHTPLAGALHLAEGIRQAVAQLRVPAGSGEWVGSVSIGVAARTVAMQGVDDLIKAADRGVYVAKRNGRNCVATEHGARPEHA